MGAQLAAFFKKAQTKAGLRGKVKLAMITKMSQVQAEQAQDTSENIAKFEAAMAQI